MPIHSAAEELNGKNFFRRIAGHANDEQKVLSELCSDAELQVGLQYLKAASINEKTMVCHGHANQECFMNYDHDDFSKWLRDQKGMKNVVLLGCQSQAFLDKVDTGPVRCTAYRGYVFVTARDIVEFEKWPESMERFREEAKERLNQWLKAELSLEDDSTDGDGKRHTVASMLQALSTSTGRSKDIAYRGCLDVAVEAYKAKTNRLHEDPEAKKVTFT
eukprot:TRINITY_DN104816_c0_g1_i1.p1 TRINITY_DN104816_c0_g1~~TRINITY_DN104816_c0_g1_i1.p1  ORF type:complete len:218 (+),score=46.70 TRINITY_DN104816_c0_g1_i1:64-717(+)